MKPIIFCFMLDCFISPFCTGSIKLTSFRHLFLNIFFFDIFFSRGKKCAELYKSGQRISGVYTIDPDGSGAFDELCDQTTVRAGGGGGGVDSVPEETGRHR